MRFEKGFHRLSLSAGCAFLTGILYLFIILYAVAVPAGGRFETGNFFEGYAENPALMNFLWAVLAAIAMLSLVVVPAVRRRIAEKGSEWIAAAEQFGVAGSIVSAATFLTMLGSAPGLAQSYAEGNTVSQTAINAVGLAQLDPYRVLSLGGTGIWFLIINFTAWQKKAFSGIHAWLGILLGGFLWAAVMAAIIHIDGLDLAASAVGGLCAPVWYFLTAKKLLQPDWSNSGVR